MIAIGCDHGGYELKLEIIKYLEEKGLEGICGLSNLCQKSRTGNYRRRM